MKRKRKLFVRDFIRKNILRFIQFIVRLLLCMKEGINTQ